MAEPLAVPRLSHAARQRLIEIARATLRAELAGEVAAAPPAQDLAELETPGAAFVTLRRRDGELRGCIGTAVPRGPLGTSVRELAISAATKDRRFSPVRADELDEIVIDVSVLSALEPADVERIEIGLHGLVVKSEGGSGLLLPQVASERGWDRETFLRQTCRKAGLPEDSWCRAGTTVLWFACDVIREDETTARWSG
jgi:AmmeMemoRadiSam system protein A